MKTICLYLLLSLPALVFGQSVSKNSQIQKKEIDQSTDLDEKIYSKAVMYGDIMVAKNALYSLMAKYPDRYNYLDSLVRLYFTTGNYAQVVLSGRDFLLKSPENMMTMEMIAISENSLERYKEALADYEKLYAKSKNLFHAYQIAVINYTLKRFEEAKVVQDEIINNPKAGKDSIQIIMNEKEAQYVVFKAAAYNLKGATLKEQRLFDEAKASFAEALKISPNFRLAQNNLNLLKTPEANSPQNPSKAEDKKDSKK